MAKVVLVKNVFNPEDHDDEKEVKAGITVREYIESEGLNETVYETECECYDPESDTWSIVMVSDEEGDALNVSILANMDEVGLDYMIKEDDIIVITILPAAKAASAFSTILSIAGGILVGIGAGMVTGGAAFIVGGIACTLLSAVISLVSMPNNESKKKQLQDDEGEQAPSLVGTNNQSLVGNPFPAVMGSLEVVPYVIGSPYNNLVIKTESGVPTKASRYGNKMKQTVLLAVGYGPLFINDIKLNNMPLSRNPNNVLSGLLGNNEVNDKFEGNSFENEIGSTYKPNNFKLEISQFGNHRTIYPYSVKQKNLDVTLLYCYDNKYSSIATEHQISWQGATFPTGMRTNSVYFSEAMPYKVAVGIEFPQGLYKEYTDDNGNFIYDKIPMHLVIQWRPVYKYTEMIDEKNGRDDSNESTNVYDKVRDGYSMKRYGAWRNFDNTKDKVAAGAYWKDRETGEYVEMVPKVKYSSAKEIHYYKYYDDEDNKKYYQDAFGLFLLEASSLDDNPDGSHNWKKTYYAPVYTNKLDFSSNLRKFYRKKYQTEYKVVSSQYFSSYAGLIYSTNYSDASSGKVITQYQLTVIVNKKVAEGVSKYFTNQGAAYGVTNHSIEIGEDKTNQPSAREVKLNYGLSEGTSTNSNPNWNGIECFSFGKYSCGPQSVYDGDPGQVDCFPQVNLKDAKDSMLFEITATLDQEDILDLINKNPWTNTEGQEKTGGMANVITDSIEIRVIRLTPCYIDKVVDRKQHTYADVVKWRYIKTYSIDKTMLKKDCETVVEEKVVEESSGEKSTVSYTKINCVTDGSSSEKGYAYNNWPVADYRSKPLNDLDQKKMVTLAVECEPDKLGYIKDSLKKISVRASAITPALKTSYVRYWRTEGVNHYYYDSYDTEDTISTRNVPEMSIHWILDDKNVYEANKSGENPRIKTSENLEGFEYQVMDREWESAFFPKTVRQETIVQPRMRPDSNTPEYNDNGEILYDTINYGNSWFRYIENEMSRHKSDKGKWIAKDSFLRTFINQNAIAQVLGFMCGKAIGRESKTYNSLNNDHIIRLWYVNDGKYFYYDTEFTEPPSVWYSLPALPTSEFAGVWIDTTEEYFRTFEIEGNASDNIKWCYCELKSSFNMLALRESYNYTNAIDFGGSDGAIQWNYNLYLTSQKKLSDVFREILVGGLAYWYYDDRGRYEIHNDKPRTNPVLLITDEDCISSSNTREFKKGIGGYHVTFKDEDNGGRPGEIYVLRADQDLQKPTRDILELSLNGITNSAQAWAYGAYMLGQSICQRESWNRKLNHIGHSLRIGSLVEVQGSTILVGTDHSGRIQKLIEDDRYIYGFVLDGMYNYRGEYDDDGKNVQGCTLMQSASEYKSRIVTLNFANRTQQENGIEVVIDDRVVTFKNNMGDTNLVLFEKKIVKDKRSIETETGAGISPTMFDPHPGDVVAFGNVGSITSKAVVYELSYDSKSRVSVSLYPYFESVYTSGGTLPVYQTNMTRLERNGNIPVDENYISLGMNNFVDKEQLKDAVAGIEEGNGKEPALPSFVSAMAYRDYIEFVLQSDSDGVLSNQIRKIKYILNKNGTEIEFNGDLTARYYFDRETDGYPEWEELHNWKISYVAQNVYGIESKESTKKRIQTAKYGTWQIGTPVVMPRVADRTATLIMSIPPRSDRREIYGDIKYRVSIKRYDDSEWFCPDTRRNPYENELYYKDESSSNDYLETGNVYSQCLPLEGQDTSNIIDTTYIYRIVASSEAGVSEEETVSVTALCTSLRDIVKAKETAKEAYVTELSAISANLGLISEGGLANNKTNYWAMSNIEVGSEKYKKGAFRVGGNDEYIKVIPSEEIDPVTGDPLSYSIEFKVGDFQVSTTATSLSGDLILQQDDNALDRAYVAPNKIALQHRNSVNSSWYDITTMDTSGITGISYRSKDNIIIGNFTQTKQRQLGHDIGRPYLTENAKVWHFDDDFKCNDGTSGGLVFSGTYKLRGVVDNSILRNNFDYTPAVLNVAPYCNNAKSATGMFSMKKKIENSEKLTVDFWMQYLYAENQTLFSIGTTNDVIKLQIAPDEPVAVVSGSCVWRAKNEGTIYTASRNPTVNAGYYDIDPDDFDVQESGKIASIKVDSNFLVTSVITDTGVEYMFDSGNADFNWEIYAPEDVWGATSSLANRAKPGQKEIIHDGQASSESIPLESVGKEFNSYEWSHVAVVFTQRKIKLLYMSVNDETDEVGTVEFDRYGSASDDFDMVLNGSEGSILIDELYIDIDEEYEGNFLEQTKKRYPWGALDCNEKKWFVFDAEDPSKVRSNILDWFRSELLASDDFKNKVKAIISEV